MGRIDELLSRCHPAAFALLRIVAGILLMQHGAQKLFGAIGGVDGAGASVPLGSLMGLAGVIEFFLAALVVVGLFTRIAAFIVSGEMAAAYFMGHAGNAFWPVANHGELAVLYCFVFLLIAAAGAGAFSLDAVIGKSRGRGAESSGSTSALAG